jgi:hypothetical protein
MTKDCSNYQLIRAFDDYCLFTDIAEKKLIVKGFKIINSEDFSEAELFWLKKNHNFNCKSKYV